MNSIDPNVFFDDLSGKPFCLDLTEEQKLRLKSVFAYWKKHFDDDEDLRKLAFVLANVHRDKPELPTTGSGPSKADDTLRTYFDVGKPAWSGVKHTTGEVNG